MKIEVKNLTKKFNNFLAVDNISFSIEKNKIVGLLGPNGCGKTTSIGMMLGLIKPCNGNIFINDKDLNKINKYEILEKINFASPYIELPKKLTVKENLEIYARLYSVKNFNNRIDEIINDLNLKKFLEKKTGELSSGQKTRVSLAKALINKPEILFLDEPTAGVDVELRQDMWKVVESLRKTGVTIILTTHYIEEAEAIADRVGVINQGEIIVVDETKELLKKMGHKKLTVDLQEEIKELPSSLEKYNLEIGEDKKSVNYTYNVRAKSTGITNLLQDLKDANLKLQDLKTEQTTLEKIFVSLVKENNEV